jgi:hypothetical protein
VNIYEITVSPVRGLDSDLDSGGWIVQVLEIDRGGVTLRHKVEVKTRHSVAAVIGAIIAPCQSS